jgi:hypothetical protein
MIFILSIALITVIARHIDDELKKCANNTIEEQSDE